MIEPTTKEITTSITKVKVVIKDWITAREQQEVQNVVFSKMKFDLSQSAQREGKQTGMSNIDPAAAVEMQNKQAEVYVVSIDGETTNLMETMLNLPDGDFAEITQAINGLDAKKNSETTTS